MKEEERPVVCACSLEALNHPRAAHVANGWLWCWSVGPVPSFCLLVLYFKQCVSASVFLHLTNCIIIKMRCCIMKLRSLSARARERERQSLREREDFILTINKKEREIYIYI